MLLWGNFSDTPPKPEICPGTVGVQEIKLTVYCKVRDERIPFDLLYEVSPTRSRFLIFYRAKMIANLIDVTLGPGLTTELFWCDLQ